MDIIKITFGNAFYNLSFALDFTRTSRQEACFSAGETWDTEGRSEHFFDRFLDFMTFLKDERLSFTWISHMEGRSYDLLLDKVSPEELRIRLWSIEELSLKHSHDDDLLVDYKMDLEDFCNQILEDIEDDFKNLDELVKLVLGKHSLESVSRLQEVIRV